VPRILEPIRGRLRRPAVLLLHLALVPLSYGMAFLLRFEFDVPAVQARLFLDTVLLLTAVRMLSFAAFGLYSGWWRHAGIRDLLALVKSLTVGSGVFVCALFATQHLDGSSRSILILEWGLSLLVFGGIRFAVRAVREGPVGLPWKAPAGRRTLIIGAGQAAERLLRECQRDGHAEIAPVALVDDDPGKAGMLLHGVRVIGTTADLAGAVARTGAEMLVISIPSAARDEMRRIVDACMALGKPFKITPSLRELVDGRVRASQIRDVQIEDLLGRDAVEMELEDVRGDLEGKVVLVTGGAGSIGSELARQVAGFNPARLIVLDQAESPLYFIHLDLVRQHPGLNVVPVVADVTDERRIDRVFEQHRPEYVFHAAAYKHVPLMEANSVEAVRTNVFGTLTVAQAAARHRARRFVLISTDKAVHPSSVMGATKRVAEQIVLGWPALRAADTDFRAVRFGNVLGSDGSVIPLFKRQLSAGEPLTVTHADVTRYFMTIPEAVQLVLRAAALPDAARRICMLEMGEPVRIVELAENLIRLSGLEPYRDVQIVFTGLRPGEKLHEELMSDLEETVETAVAKVRIVRAAEPEPDGLATGLDRLAAAAAVGGASDLLCALCALVPECVSPLRERGRTPTPVQ
jgi:FlaA1/EpsC-like NDP-sugar epimerase